MSSFQETGTIRFWSNGERGYGFIGPDDGGEAVFVHHSCIARRDEAKPLSKGARVTYEVGGRKLAGLWAKDVSMAD